MDDRPGYEEGDVCNRGGCDGIVERSEPENCSCHLHSPCGSCLETHLFCSVCDWHEEEET